MSLWIKVCGNTSLEDARMAVDAGADAVGFVFAPSPRRVTVEQVAAIITKLPTSVETMGVFVDATVDEIVGAARGCGLTGVQLHFAASRELPGQLRALLGPGVRILRVVHFGAGAVEQVAEVAADADVDAVLVDSRAPLAEGGTGVAFDWAGARETIFGRNGRVRMVAAGGLTPANVAEAIVTLRPWGVDAVSGIEAAPGRKDLAKVRAFILNARAAASTGVK